MRKKALNIILEELEKNIESTEKGSIEQSWTKYREDLINQKNLLEKQTDKIIFTISTGAIGVSLAVIDKIALPHQYFFLYAILGLSWLFLVISIILQSISFEKTAKSIGDSIIKINLIIGAQSSEEQRRKIDDYDKEWNTKNNLVDKRGKITFTIMICGIILLLLFTFISLFLRGSQKELPWEKIQIQNSKT